MKQYFTLTFLMLAVILTAAAQTRDGRGTWYETDSKGLNASHYNLPFGTRIRVTNLQNDKQVIVTINNRIVETPNRLIDISKAAANNIEMNPRGTTPVRIEVLSRRAVEQPHAEELAPQPEAPVPPAAEPEPSREPKDEQLTVTTTATAWRPVPVQPEQTPVPAPAAVPVPAAVPAPEAANPAGIVNQTIITINGVPGVQGVPQPTTFPETSGGPVYASAEGVSVRAGMNPQAVSPAYAAPAPAVVSPNPAVVTPMPAVVSPAPAVIPPVIVPPVVAQPVLASPVVVPPVVSEPIVSEPVIARPAAVEPVRSAPVTVPPANISPTPAVLPARTSAAPALVSGGPARVIPRMPDPASRTLYRVQVGSFLDQANAVNAFDRLRAAGFSPAYEQYNEYYRVVLTGVRAGEMESIARRLGNANFKEALLREER